MDQIDDKDLEEQESKLQTARHVWAIFDAMGPGKAPKKCDRPFTGRQQDLYQDSVTLTTDIHLSQLKNSLLNDQLDDELSILESLYIAKGLDKLKQMEKESIPEEMSVVRGWYYELKAYKTMRDEDVETEKETVFIGNDLCMMIEYLPEDTMETLSFSTRHRGKAYKIVIKYQKNKRDLKVECQEEGMENMIESDLLGRLILTAIKNRFSARKLVREGIWKWLDKTTKVGGR